MKDDNYIRFESCFPVDNTIARWIVGLGMIHNDLTSTRKRLTHLVSNDDLTDQLRDLPSLVRLIASSLREAIFYLEESENSGEIKQYINSMPEDILVKYSELRKMFRQGQETDLLQRFTNIRNITFHYTKPQKDELSRALEALKERSVLYDEESDVFLFAETVRDTILVRALFSSEEIESRNTSFANELISKLHKTFYLYIEFSNLVVRSYLKDFSK